MANELLTMLQYDFMQRAFIAGLLIAVTAPVVGMFLVVRRYAMLSDTLAHISLVGVAASLMSGFLNPVLGATTVSVLSSIGIEELRSKRKLFGESVLALFLSGSLAVAVIMIGLAHGMNTNFMQYLFGSIATVSAKDLLVSGILNLIVLTMVVLFYRPFFLIAYDEELAISCGIKAKAYNMLFMSMAAIVVSQAMPVVGGLLVGALMIIPVLTALQFRLSFRNSIIVSIIFSLASVLIGLTASYLLGLASGATIVVVALILFIISVLASKSS